jgi:hypothetical protein
VIQDYRLKAELLKSVAFRHNDVSSGFKGMILFYEFEPEPASTKHQK